MAEHNLYRGGGLMVIANELLEIICMQIDNKYTYKCNMNCSLCVNNCKYELGKLSHYALWSLGSQMCFNI